MTSRTIKPIEPKHLLAAEELVEKAFAERWDPDEGRVVRELVREIRAGKYYMPELEIIAVDDTDEVIGYAMFSRFHIEGRYEDELLLLAPVAVKTELQRRHISKDMIEFGFERARGLGFKAVLVEGDPRNYNPRGFRTSRDCGIVAGPKIHLPAPECLMVAELVPGGLDGMRGEVDYSCYKMLCGK